MFELFRQVEKAVTQTEHRTNDSVRRALEGLRADLRREDADGIDFYLGELSGFARPRRGELRISYFLDADDPDPLDAERFIATSWVPPHTRLELTDIKGGAALRLLVELPFDATEEIRATSQAARALHFAWHHRHDEEGELGATLGAAGIALPSGTAGRMIHTYGAWSWGSLYVSPQLMYMFDVAVVARLLLDHGGFFALSHAGHGFNSYGLNLVTSQGPIAAFVQHGYGGAFMDPVAALISINTTYSKLHVLLEALDETPVTEPRWLLAYSTFRGATELIDLAQLRAGSGLDSATVPFENESQLFEAVVERLQLQHDDFAMSERVSW